jgi:mono/diheme cytochrome c family protein
MPSLSWVELHGALTHIPIAFLLAVSVFEVGAALLRKPEWRIVSFWLLVGAVVTAVPSLITGWITGNDLRFTGNAVQSPGVFVTHRLFAFTTSGFAVILLLWRVKAKDRLSGRALGASILLSLVVAAGIGYTGFLGGRMVFGGTGRESAQSSGYVPMKSTDKIKTPVVEPQLVATGQKLFQTLPCQSCHRMDGKGGISGPDLTHEARRHSDIAWHIAHLKDPQKMKPGSDMPPFDTLPPADLKALAAYLATRK